MIDYIRKVKRGKRIGLSQWEGETDDRKVAYIGHSMGTTIMFHLAVKRPEYVRENISTIIATGPVLNPSHIDAPLVKAVLPI